MVKKLRQRSNWLGWSAITLFRGTCPSTSLKYPHFQPIFSKILIKITQNFFTLARWPRPSAVQTQPATIAPETCARVDGKRDQRFSRMPRRKRNSPPISAESATRSHCKPDTRLSRGEPPGPPQMRHCSPYVPGLHLCRNLRNWLTVMV